MKQPFKEGDGGCYFLLSGNLRDDFEILCQRQSLGEIEAFRLSLADPKKNQFFTTIHSVAGHYMPAVKP
jgi:hypothetical protein